MFGELWRASKTGGIGLGIAQCLAMEGVSVVMNLGCCIDGLFGAFYFQCFSIVNLGCFIGGLLGPLDFTIFHWVFHHSHHGGYKFDS